MLQLARCIPFGVYIADLLQFQGPFEREWIHRPTTKEQDVAGVGDLARDLLDGRLGVQGLRDEARQRAERGEVLVAQRGPDRAAGLRGPQREERQHRELAGEGLGRGHPHLHPGADRQRETGFPGDGTPGHVHHRGGLRLAGAVAERRERVRRFARLADEERERAGRDRRLAVAELGGDVDLGGKPRHPLEPVFRHVAGVSGGAAGHHQHPLHSGKIDSR